MSKKLRIQTLIFCLIFTCVSMTAMLYYSANKMIVIAEAGQEASSMSSEGAGRKQTQKTFSYSLALEAGGEHEDYLCIPLPADIKAEKVTLENHYMNQELWVYIEDAPKNFYMNHAVSGKLNQVEAASMEPQNDGTWIKLELTEVLECRSIMEKDCLLVEFVKPRELYDKIVVIDAGHGGDDSGHVGNHLMEKDVTLDIVKRLKEMLDDTDIKVYYTRLDDTSLADEDRVTISNIADADMFISIHAASQPENEALCGTQTFYNSAFFIPEFGNVELADLLEREVVTAINGKAIGLVEADKACYVLKNAKVPAALIEVGHLSHKEEADLLAKDVYRQQIAKGIYEAIIKAYETIENNE